jgi:AraC family transcriptional regulator, arabinose operon regulatory protein
VWPEVAAGILSRDLTDDPLLERTVACFHDVVTTARGPWQRRDALALSQLEQLLLWLDAARGDAPGGVLDERIRAAVEHCHERYAHPWSVAELAAVAGMSSSRFAHRFREVMGSSPVAYLEHIRLQAAKDLLLFSGRSIADIADAVGIPDAAWFAKRFRRWSGLAPRRFRQVGGTRHGSP